MDGLEKDLAEVNALASVSADLMLHQTLAADRRPSPAAASEEKEKTLAGLVIGGTWDLVAGKAATSQDRIDRAHKADQYAEIAADTFSSIPKFSALTGGIAHSILLIDVSGQTGAAGIAKGMAFNFMQGAALSGVSRIACSESAVGRLFSSRLGAGIAAEVATHAVAGGGFGLVKSGMSEHSWMDSYGNFSLSTGLKNVATGTSIGAVIGVPAGMAGLRVGKAVTIGLGSQVEHSAVASMTQKFAVGAGSGFASGSVFGGVDAAKSGKSWSQILDSTLSGGMIGLVTGGVSSGFDRTQPRALTGGGGESTEHFKPAMEMEASSGSNRSRGQTQPRDLDGPGLTEKMVNRANYLLAGEGLKEAYERLGYELPKQIRPEDFSHRLKVPVLENRKMPTLKDSAPKTYEEYQTALKTLKGDDEPLDYTKHLYKPYVDDVEVPMRIYGVKGHTTKIVVPESYAKQLDEVRILRQANDSPSAYDRLSRAEKSAVSAIVKSGDASALAQFMTAPEITQYIKVFQSGQQLMAHPMRYRALPEDLVPVLDALPNRGLLKEVHLLDTRHVSDLHKAVLYGAPKFISAATVGHDAVVNLHKADYGSSLYRSVFHEWAHVAKWQSPAFSKMFDLGAVVDRLDENIDHQATANIRVTEPTHEDVLSKSMYYPDLHSTRSQDENFAVGLGEEILSPEPNDLFAYLYRAPVRGLTLTAALQKHLIASSGTASTLDQNILERIQYAKEVSRPNAIVTLKDRLSTGTAEEKAAAAQLMAQFGTTEQGVDLLRQAGNKGNKVVPRWEGTAAETAMEGDGRTVAQHAFDAYLTLMHKGDANQFEQAMALMVQKPELKDVAADYISRSTDARTDLYRPLIEKYNPAGTALERVVGVPLIQRFGGDGKADLLLSMALQKDNDIVPNLRDTDIPSQFAFKHRTVAQTAYQAYIEASAGTNAERFDFALKQGIEKPNQRELATRYLLKGWDPRAQGFGQFLEMYDLPGHVSKMQELIGSNFRDDATSQKMIFDRMMQLTDKDPRRQMELITDNMHVKALMPGALKKMDSIMTHPTTRQQREEIAYAVTERMRWDNYSQADKTHMDDLLNRVNQENKLQDALTVVERGNGERVAAMHELSVLHDPRAIKPLLQQAVSANGLVAEEAIGALRQFNPTLVKFYAQELKREYGANPVMSGKLTELIVSHKLSPAG